MMRLRIFGVNQRRKRKEEDKERRGAGERRDRRNERQTHGTRGGAVSEQPVCKRATGSRENKGQRLQHGHGALSHTGVVADR